MKIIFNKEKPIIECSYDEGVKLIKEFLLDRKVEDKLEPKIENEEKPRKYKRGKYKHKSRITDKEKELIKKITIQYPDRKDSNIAEELNKFTNSSKFTREIVRYWRLHG